MALQVSLTFNLEAALKQMNLRVTNDLKVAAARGITRTAESEKVALSREVAENMGLPVGFVKKVLTVRQATANNLTARVKASGAPLPLIAFSARGPEPSRGRGRGVSYRMQGEARRLPHAFIATTPTGHRGVFARKGLARLPIVEKFGPSIAHVFGNVLPRGEQRRQESLLKNVQHELEFALSRS